MEKQVFGLSDKQRAKLLEVRSKHWNKPLSLWKKMRFNKGQMSFTGKR